MPAEVLLSRLTGVRQSMPDRWLARCPVHRDKTASLSIREASDGRVLVHCFAGCGTDAILDAVGLRFSDLFPERLPALSAAGNASLPPLNSAFTPRELLAVLEREILVASLILHDALFDPLGIGEAEWSRLAKAHARIVAAREHGH